MTLSHEKLRTVKRYTRVSITLSLVLSDVFTGRRSGYISSISTD